MTIFKKKSWAIPVPAVAVIQVGQALFIVIECKEWKDGIKIFFIK